MKDINRLRVLLAEKEEDKEVGMRAVGRKPYNCFKMVYELLTTQFGDAFQNDGCVGCRTKPTDKHSSKETRERTVCLKQSPNVEF